MWNLLPMLSATAEDWIRDAKRRAVLYGLAGLFVLTLYSLLIAACVVMLAAEYGVIAALLYTTAFFAILTAVVLGLHAMWNNRHKRRVRQDQQRQMLYTAAAVTALPLVLRSRTMLALSAAGVAALMLLGNGRDNRPRPGGM